MPELTRHTAIVCRSVVDFRITIGSETDFSQFYSVTFSDREGWHRTCPHHVNRRAMCKHIKKAKPQQCNWGVEALGGTFPEPPEDKNICPNCGGPTTAIMVGV